MYYLYILANTPAICLQFWSCPKPDFSKRNEPPPAQVHSSHGVGGVRGKSCVETGLLTQRTASLAERQKEEDGEK